MAYSPYVDNITNKKEIANEVIVEKKESCDTKSMSLKYVALVVAVLVVIMLLYYSVSCFSGNTKPNKKSEQKNTILEKSDSFSVEEAVEKLRTKQDEFKARL